MCTRVTVGIKVISLLNSVYSRESAIEDSAADRGLARHDAKLNSYFTSVTRSTAGAIVYALLTSLHLSALLFSTP